MEMNPKFSGYGRRKPPLQRENAVSGARDQKTTFTVHLARSVAGGGHPQAHPGPSGRWNR